MRKVFAVFGSRLPVLGVDESSGRVSNNIPTTVASDVDDIIGAERTDYHITSALWVWMPDGNFSVLLLLLCRLRKI